MSEPEEEAIEVPEVIEALDKIAKDDSDGLIQPHAVVEAARDPDSPLHDYFEWDDTAAAAAYRLVQARYLIARVTVRVTERRPALVNVRVRTAEGNLRRGYVSLERAVADPELYEQVVADAVHAITSYRNRLSAFTQARAAVERLDAALKELTDS